MRHGPTRGALFGVPESCRRAPVIGSGTESHTPELGEQRLTKESRGTSVGPVAMDRLYAVFDGMFDGVWMVGPDGHTTYANAAMADLLGLSRAELHRRTLKDFLDPSLHARADAFLERQRTVPGERTEFRFRRDDGRELVGMLAASPIATADGTFVGTMLNFSDVTGKRAYEAQAVQDEKMRAIGEFAAGLAHDFNNLLTAIRGHAELATLDAPADSAVRGDLEQIVVGAERASLITRSLLAFTRRQVLEPALIDAGQAVAALVPSLAVLVGSAIQVHLDVRAQNAWVMFDPTQFEQVLIHLAVNARDAMPDGGRFNLTVGNVEPPRAERPDPATAPQSAVRITVADTGRGMDETTRARAFDPFFTTKAMGRGTGLGLASVFGIVTQSRGQIQVESTPGEGSTFIIDLPGVPPPHAATAPHAGHAEGANGVNGSAGRGQAATVTPASAETGVVLVVDDEPAIREIGRRALQRAGYSVLTAADGEEAIRQAASRPGSIDVLLTDVVMPGMHGLELAERIRAQRPNVSVILMSGYAQDVIEQPANAGYDAFVAKPFTPAGLVGAVERVRDARGLRAPAAAVQSIAEAPTAG